MASKKVEGQFHEHMSHDEVEEIGSDRSFGFVFTAFFAVLGCWPLWDGQPVNPYLLGVSGVFLVLALVIPKVLHPLNVVWMKFAALLNRIVSPIVLGLLFFVTITPMALALRIMGKDPLHRSFSKEAKSYWIERKPPGPPPESMRNQF